MLLTTLRRIETFLYRKGFRSETARTLLAVQIMVALGASVIGLAALPLGTWPIAFGLGALVATANFWQLCRIAQAYTMQTFSRQLWMRLFLGFNARLAASGVVLFLAIITFNLPLFPLLAGLGLSMICILAWGVGRTAGKPIKES